MEPKTKEYIRPMPATWWLHNRHVFLFMVRELTSVFVLGYAVFLLYLLFRFRAGQDVFHQFFASLQSPAAVVLQVIALMFVLYHSITSFNAAPTIMPVQRGDEKVDPRLVAGANYALWVIVTVVILIVVLW
jgi:fumarate reductase subunit C